jgi:hypothetical protein
MSNLLLDERPLLVLPKLAEVIGLNEAIALQQIHYWIKESNKVHEGRQWTYNTYEEWLKQFPFWSKSTLRRTFTSLEKQGLLITDNFNKMKADKTKWYTIDYNKLQSVNSPCVQNEQSIVSNWTHGSVQNEQSNTLDYTKTSPKTNDIYIQYAEFVKMKESEHQKLVKEHGELLTKEMITALDNYKGANGKKYKSDYRAILTWVKDKILKEQGGVKNKTTTGNQYDNLF